MEINRRRRPELVAGIRDALRAIWIDHQVYVDENTLAGLEAAQGRLSVDEQKVLAQHVGIRPLVNFAYSFLNHWLEPRGFSNGQREQLKDLMSGAELDDLASAIVTSIERLPHSYTFSIALSDAIDAALPDAGAWRVTPSIDVAKGDGFHASYPIHRANVPNDDRFLVKYAGLLNEPLPKIGKAHITFKMSGFLQRFSVSTPSQEAVDLQIRSFFGLALAFNVVRYQVPHLQTEHVYVYVHVPKDAGPNEPWMRFPLSTSTSRVIQALQFSKGVQPHGWPASAGDGEWVNWVLEHQKGERLVRAARWFFDSFGADSLLLQYLQAMICLEILLGDEASKGQEVSIVSTLKNRCAYLIGSDLAERDKIMKDISRIYQVRSDIVHNGLSQLSVEDRSLLPILRWYCARVIHAEAQCLGVVVPPPPPGDGPPSLENAEGAAAGMD